MSINEAKFPKKSPRRFIIMGNLVQPEEEMKCVHRAPGFEREQRKKPNSSCHLLDWLEPPKDVVGPCKLPSGSSAWGRMKTPLSLALLLLRLKSLY